MSAVVDFVPQEAKTKATLIDVWSEPSTKSSPCTSFYMILHDVLESISIHGQILSTTTLVERCKQSGRIRKKRTSRSLMTGAFAGQV